MAGEKKTRVLIVDDSPLVLARLILRLSEEEGILLVGTAYSASEVMEAIEQLKPDAVVLDIHLSGKSGLEVLKKVKKQRPGLTVIVLTNYSQPQYEDKSFELGADYFFDKSSDFEEVVGILRGLRKLPSSED